MASVVIVLFLQAILNKPHVAFGAETGMILLYFKMHGAGPNRTRIFFLYFVVIVVHKNLKKKIHGESNGGEQKPDVSINLMELVLAGHN